MSILITGGAGYIGSHLTKILLENGYQTVVVDNLKKGHKAAVLGGDFIKGDFQDQSLLEQVFNKFNIDAVIHLAADSLVEESMKNPGKYYHNNFDNGIILLDKMLKYNVNKIVFSSTAAVYGEVKEVPISENHPVNPTNPYGESKYFFEKILKRYDQLFDLNYISLRYFNAAGADPSGLIGEDHKPETHLIPLVLDTALKVRDKIHIFGEDYDTKDGTCIRDYIHVNDLGCAHLLSLNALLSGKESSIYNLGNGKGYSVKEVIKTVKKLTKKDFKVVSDKRRVGDPPILVASSDKIKNELNWRPKYPELEKIIETAYNWHQKGCYDK